METWQLVLTMFGAVFACSGFWTFIQSRRDNKNAKSQLILGLGHDRILSLCAIYLARPDGGWITHTELDNLIHYLYEPYTKAGGNGTAKIEVDKVKKLPVKPDYYIWKGDIDHA